MYAFRQTPYTMQHIWIGQCFPSIKASNPRNNLNILCIFIYGLRHFILKKSGAPQVPKAHKQNVINAFNYLMNGRYFEHMQLFEAHSALKHTTTCISWAITFATIFAHPSHYYHGGQLAFIHIFSLEVKSQHKGICWRIYVNGFTISFTEMLYHTSFHDTTAGKTQHAVDYYYGWTCPLRCEIWLWV